MPASEPLVALQTMSDHWDDQKAKAITARDFDAYEKARAIHASYHAALLLAQALRRDDAPQS